MGQFTNFARATALVAIGALSVASQSTSTALAASKTKNPAAAAPAAATDPAAEKQKDTDAARRALDAGAKSYQAGKYQPAVDELSTALRGGGLGGAEMARALYYRGLAYKKQSKPGLAISDLTSALWLKNGLGDAERQTASAERSEAYRMAGLGEGNSGTETVAVADPNLAKQSANPAPSAVPSAAPVTNTVVTSGNVSRQSPDSEAAREAAQARKLASAPVEGGGFQAAAAGALIADQPRSAPAVTAAVEPVAIPAPIPAAAPVAVASTNAPSSSAPVLSAIPMDSPAPVSAASDNGNAVTGFFKNLFSGGSSAVPAPDSAPVTTASTTPSVATSSWSDTTSVATGSSKKTVKPVQQAALQPAPKATSGGKFKVHIAAVRSRQEAEALAQKIATQHGAALNSRTPVVDEAVIGSMGTFYRVRVGSYATADEPRGLCNTLRSSGYDCLVVTN